MRINSLIFSLICLTCTVKSMKSGDVCLQKNEACNGRLNYMCSKYCSSGPEQCDRFLEVRKMLKLIRLGHWSLMLPSNSIEKYETLMTELRQCPKSAMKITLNKNEVCKIKQACYDSIRVPLSRNRYTMGIKRVACKCSGRIPIQCGQKYCSLNQDVCSNLLKTSKNFLSRLDFCSI